MELTKNQGRKKRPFFCLDFMDNIWLVILKEALEGLVARTGEPVAGAKLRAEVKKLADDRGEQFPPEGMTKWSAFVSSFRDDITVIHNPGSDVLVLPVSRPDLRQKADAMVAATAAPASTPVRLRSDIFEALTRIPAPNERPVYQPETDAVLWLHDADIAPTNAVPFPKAKFEEEVELRLKFANRNDGLPKAAKDALVSALRSDGPLRQFTHGIRSYGLIQEWHVFRMAALSEKLRIWATAHALSFQDGWLGSDEPRAGVNPAAALSSVAAGHKRGLVELAGLLTDEDISRISVPLDLVLRLLAPR